MKRLFPGSIFNLKRLIVVAIKSVKGICVINDNIKQ